MAYPRLLSLLYDLFCFVLTALFDMGAVDSKGRPPADAEPYAFRAFRYERVRADRKLCRRVPLPRSGHRIVCDGGNLYSFGGYNPAVLAEHLDANDDRDDEVAMNLFPLFQELWKYNFATRMWTRYTRREDLPQELASNAVIRHGSVLIVYGGTGSPFGQRCSNQLYICKLSHIDNRMVQLTPSGQLPLSQYGQALLYHSGYLYAIGGTTGFSYTCDIHKYNMKTHTWEAVYICQGRAEYEPTGRYRHEVAFDGRRIYVLGGGTAEDAFDFVEMPVFDLEKLRWTVQRTLPDLTVVNPPYSGYPPPRRCHGAVQLETEGADPKVFISCGDSGNETYDDLWCLNLRTYRWNLVGSCRLPYPTYFHSAAITPEGKMYIFGGITVKQETERTNKIYATWLCIPKLSEICWEALLHYNPNLVNCPKEKLINAGLPRHFANRIQFEPQT